jgi:hypothetical protein
MGAVAGFLAVLAAIGGASVLVHRRRMAVVA